MPEANSTSAGRLNGALEGGPHDVPAAGQKVAAGDGEGPAAVIDIRARGIDLILAAVAAFIGETQVERLRLGAEHGDGAAHGAVAEQAGGGAFGDLDAIQILRREERPVDPAAKGTVQGDAVPQDQRAAGAGGPETAQRDALRGGIGDQGRCAAEEREARKQAQAIVDIRARRLFDRDGVEHGDERGRFGADVGRDGNGGLDGLRRGGGRSLRGSRAGESNQDAEYERSSKPAPRGGLVAR